MRNKVIRELVSRWRDLVTSGDFEAEEMHQSLVEQAFGGCQGWDTSLEELEINPDLAEMMEWGIDDLTDDQIEEWGNIVIEAAKRYLKEEN